jgi:sporulation protein YlmC with PRC-barrel domain
MSPVPAFPSQDAGKLSATVTSIAKFAPQEAHMLKTIMAAAAVSTLALTSAMAQTSTSPSTPSGSSTPPAATTTPATPAPSASANPAGKANFVAKQTSDQWLASKFKGTDVIGTDDKKIGDVSDILFDKDKKILAYIVGVGGFLGIGQKDVAIDPASFQMVSGRDNNDFKLRLSMTKDELKAAPTFEQYQAPRPVSSSNNTSNTGATRPAGAPAPATNPAPKQ